jgi:MFS family permease
MRTTLTPATTNAAPILVLYLEQLHFSARKIGLFLSLTLLGDVVVSLCVAWTADRLGRRRMLAVGSAAMAGSGVSSRPPSQISPEITVLTMPRTARLCRFP